MATGSSAGENDLGSPNGDAKPGSPDTMGQRNTIAATLGLILSTPKGSTAKGLGRFQKYKPWDRRKNSVNPGIRVKLATIDSYDREVVSVPKATPKVMVRLERVTGTDRVRIKNFKYLEMLSKRIEEEENVALAKLHQKRAEEELRRYRELVINGEMEPVEGMEDYTDNPLYRVNRIMKRLSKVKFNLTETLNPTTKVPMIIPTEPFSDYERSGILFGHHPEHYLKAKPKVVSPRSVGGSTASIARQDGKDYAEEWDGEDYEDNEEESKPPLILPESAVAFGDLLRRNSMSLARRYLGLDPNQQVKSQRPRMIEELLTEEREAGPLYEFANQISGAMKRGQAKADDFCTKTHRKLFA